MSKVILSISLLLCFFPCKASSLQVRGSLCRAEEQVIFNCSSGKAIASICASKDAGYSSGYAKYRFGTEKKVEFELPEKEKTPSSFFLIKSIPKPGGADTTVTFFNREYTYRIEDGSGHPEGMGGGFESATIIHVEKNKKQIASLACDNYDSGLKSKAYDIFRGED